MTKLETVTLAMTLMLVSTLVFALEEQSQNGQNDAFPQSTCLTPNRIQHPPIEHMTVSALENVEPSQVYQSVIIPLDSLQKTDGIIVSIQRPDADDNNDIPRLNSMSKNVGLIETLFLSENDDNLLADQLFNDLLFHDLFTCGDCSEKELEIDPIPERESFSQCESPFDCEPSSECEASSECEVPTDCVSRSECDEDLEKHVQLDNEVDSQTMLQPLGFGFDQRTSELVEPKRHEFREFENIEQVKVAHDDEPDQQTVVKGEIIHGNEQIVSNSQSKEFYSSVEDHQDASATEEPIQIDKPVQAESPESGEVAEQILMNFSDTDARILENQTQSDLDSPMAGVDVRSTPEPNQTEGLIVHPPMVQPYNQNQHTFVVENSSSKTASDVTVEIRVPENARIVAALPVNSVFSPKAAVFKFAELKSGEKVQVHLTAVENDDQPISFTANIAAKSTYEFEAWKKPRAAELDNVSYLPGSASEQSTTKRQTDSAVIKNPFFQSEQNANHYQGQYR